MANEHTIGTLLPNTAGLAHTVTALKVAEMVVLTLVNNDTVSHGVDVWFKPNAEAINVKHKVISLGTVGISRLQAGRSRVYMFFPNLVATDEIHWAADTVSQVAGSLSVREVDADAALTNIPAAYLTGSLVTLHTVPSGRAMQTLFLAMSNHDTTSRLVEVQVIESGGSAGAAKRIVNQNATTALRPGETRLLRLTNYFPTADATIEAKADVTAKVVFSGGVVEGAIVL